MGTTQDGSTQLNPGSGGDAMDESVPQRQDGNVRKRARVVLTGDLDESAVVNPVLVNGVWCIPVISLKEESQQAAIIVLLTAINQKLAKLSGLLP